VCESVVWAEEGSSLYQRRLIASKIVQFLIQEKLGVSPDEYIYIAGQIDAKITPKFVSRVVSGRFYRRKSGSI
jgi:hypothetical protein